MVAAGGVLRERRARVHKLQGARLVAQHNKLHFLLVAHGVDPPGDRYGSVG